MPEPTGIRFYFGKGKKDMQIEEKNNSFYSCSGNSPTQLIPPCSEQKELILDTLQLYKFLKKLSLKANQRELVMALWEISKGCVYFEASYLDLACILNGINQFNEAEIEKLRIDKSKFIDKIRYALRKLIEWQTSTGLQLIQVIENGNLKQMSDGSIIYNKTKYRFVLLENLRNALNSGYDDLQSYLDKLVKDSNQNNNPLPQKSKYPLNLQRRRDRNNIITKFEKVFWLSVESGGNAPRYGQKLITKLQQLLVDLEIELEEKQIEDKIISDFKSMMGG
jgi:hypothetical protein